MAAIGSRQNFSKPGLLREPCRHDPCERRPAFGYQYCSTHRPQVEKYGFTWDEYPHEKMAAWRAAMRDACEVGGCDLPQSSEKSPLCRKHRGDFVRKKCSMEFYLSLMNATVCPICNRPGEPLVVDHDHRHHEDRDEMCESCIRDRICSACNTALGYLGEDPERMHSLAAYARRHAGKF